MRILHKQVKYVTELGTYNGIFTYCIFVIPISTFDVLYIKYIGIKVIHKIQATYENYGQC